MTRRLLLTRPLADSERFATRLPKGWQAHIAPMQAMVDLPASPDFSQADALVFTSANAVRSFARRWAGITLPAYCVGDATTAAARDAGLDAQSAGGDLRELAALLAGLPRQRLLYLHGRHISAPLDVPGQHITPLPIYDQQALPLDAATAARLTAGQFDAVALFSPRSAALLAAARDGWPPLVCACISAAVADAAAPLGPCHIATAPNAAALLATIGAIDAAE